MCEVQIEKLFKECIMLKAFGSSQYMSHAMLYDKTLI